MKMGTFAAQLSEFFNWLLRASLQASVLVCLVLLVKALLQRKLAVRWHYYLWLLLLVRLVAPWAPESRTSIFNLVPVAQRVVAVFAPANVRGDDAVAPPALEAPADSVTAAPMAVEDIPIRAPRKRSAPPFEILSIVWLAGALTLAVYASAGNIGLLAKVGRERPVTDQKILDLLEGCKAEIGVRTFLAVVQTPKVKSPALLGFVRPRLLLPEGMIETLSLEELRFVFLHEVAHIKRHDIVVNWVTAVLQVMHWFNPLIWYAFHRMRTDRELACDALALSHTQPGESQEYGRTIVNLLERFSQPRRMPGMAAILEDRSQLKRRITMIALFKRGSYRSSAFAVIVLAVVGSLALTDARSDTSEKTTLPGRVQERPLASKSVREDFEKSGQTPAALETEEVKDDTASDAVGGQDGVGIALVEFSGVGSRETLGEASAQMHELVAARLADEPGLRLVDREKLDKALEELKLSQTGLVDPATATDVGKIVGARIFVVGKLMKLGSEWVVTAKLIDTQTTEVAALRVTSKESDGLLTLADITSDEIVTRLGTFAPTRAGSPEESPWDAEIERLRNLLAKKDLPTVTVRVPESHLGTWVPDPAGENELISVLSRVGFRVVDVSTFMKRQPSRWWLNVFHGRTEEGAGTEIRVTQGFRSVSDILHDSRLEKMKENADIFIMGEAFSEYVGENYGFRSCKARVEVKAIDTDTEAIAAAASRHASAADVGEFIAGKKALKTAGGELGLQLARELAEYWEHNKDSRKEVQID